MVLRRTWVSEKFLVRSQNLGSVFDGSPWVSKSRFRVILASRSLEFFLPTVFFYLSFGLQESNFSEFMGTAYKSN